MPRVCLWLLLVLTALTGVASAADGSLALRQWAVDGRPRQALVHVPRRARIEPTPLVFAFHGHGGTARSAARMFHIHDLWPQAIVVYMEGIPTPTQLVDPEGKASGWQGRAGEHGDRDLHFFDAVLESLRHEYRIDNARIFATGHSHGGVFTYLLWAERGDVFAAVAPSAAITAPENLARLKPKAVFHAAGSQDNLVKFAWQQAVIARLIEINGCSAEGQKIGPLVTRYNSPAGHDTPVVTYIHDGGHTMPAQEPAAIVRFFKARAARAARAAGASTQPAPTPPAPANQPLRPRAGQRAPWR